MGIVSIDGQRGMCICHRAALDQSLYISDHGAYSVCLSAHPTRLLDNERERGPQAKERTPLVEGNTRSDI